MKPTNETTNETTNDRPTTDQRPTTNKNVKNIKNEKNVINQYSSIPELNDTILEFIKHRKAIKKPMSERAVKLMLNKLEKMTSDVGEQIDILNESIMNGWQGIFPLDKQKNKKAVRKETVPDWMQKKNSFNNCEQRELSDYDNLENRLAGFPTVTKTAGNNPELAAKVEALRKEIQGV